MSVSLFTSGSAGQSSWIALLLLGTVLTGCAEFPDAQEPDDCSLQHQVAIEVTMTRNIPVVPAIINGQQARLVLDTGSTRTVLSSNGVQRLQLPLDWRMFTVSSGIGGSERKPLPDVKTLAIGGFAIREPALGGGTVPWPFKSPPPDGRLGNDILAQHDVDLNLGRGRMNWYRARRCEQATPAWMEPHAVLPMRRGEAARGLFTIPVEIDGQTLTASVDTGAEFTAIGTRAATSLGITDEMLDQDRKATVIAIGGNAPGAHLHRFRLMSVGGIAMTEPDLLVLNLPPEAGDMLLGADFLRRHRVWLSYAARRMFISRGPG